MELLNAMESMIPADVFLNTLEISSTKLNLAATAGSTAGFAQFLSNLQSTKLITNIVLGDINRTASTGIEFQLSADIPGAKAK